MSLQGTFRRDAELVEDAAGTLSLRRRWGPRVLSVALVLIAAGIAVFDWRIGRPLLAVVHAALTLGFIGLVLRAEFDSFVFSGGTAVRRWLTLSGLNETRLGVKSISRIGVERAGSRARAWIETKDGQQVALVDGDARSVEAMAEKLARAIRLAAEHRPPQYLN